ncbi:serine hydrolase domain-containing protein [Paucibacter sp. DJ2R-2]|uniref:serine hydrolase domain-containing protein n=1 Tax=Paucibacter sp. DJ2R-2 TaxID=2893558 RepID=UPI0021E48395|nr:serine hydrolase [Paucibacter sp. DJ2R-2]MCV2422615.1 beta-lactamase family protein [Paucibacter sp. DJ4R-1]MCV2438813.1 beta-lactamase family protein [Paucibacter sp. DJ2R-2]
MKTASSLAPPSGSTRASVLLCLLLTLGSASVCAAPDEELLGRAQGYPVGHASNWFSQESVRVGSFSHQGEILGLMNGGVRELAPSAQPLTLLRSATEPTYRWHIDALRNLGVDDYLARQRVMGLLVIKDGVIQVERYQYRRGPQHRFVSNSMSKSLVSLAVGLALKEGLLHSLDDAAQRYAPALTGSLYGPVRLRDLLRMASGLRFTERYDGVDDLERFGRVAAREGLEAAAVQLGTRAAPPGERFNYASADTIALTLVLRGATGMGLSEYLQSRLWEPMGAEMSALWRTDRLGVEIASGNFNAGLRDYGRLGMLLAHDGQRPDSGRQVLPRDYLLEATDAGRHPAMFSPGQATPYFGYGYQFWTFPGRARRFALLGVYGQMIFVDPALKLVMVQTSANAKPHARDTSLAREADAFWRGLVAYYGGSW